MARRELRYRVVLNGAGKKIQSALDAVVANERAGRAVEVDGFSYDASPIVTYVGGIALEACFWKKRMSGPATAHKTGAAE